MAYSPRSTGGKTWASVRHGLPPYPIVPHLLITRGERSRRGDAQPGIFVADITPLQEATSR